MTCYHTFERYAPSSIQGLERFLVQLSCSIDIFSVQASHFIPPDDSLAAEFNITYDPAVWGQDNDTRHWAIYPGGFNPMRSINAILSGSSQLRDFTDISG